MRSSFADGSIDHRCEKRVRVFIGQCMYQAETFASCWWAVLKVSPLGVGPVCT